MRRTSVIAAACAATIAVVLAGCSGSPSASPSPSGSAGLSVSAAEMPTATGGFGDKPTITFPSKTPPSGLQTEVLVKGTGAKVKSGDLISVNYLGQVWDGDVFDNSYDRGAATSFGIGVGQVIKGWDEALVGQTVGSRVIMSIPPDLAYGNQKNGSIPANSYLTFVVDILDDTPGSATGQADAKVVADPKDKGITVTGDLGAPVTAIKVADGTAEPTQPSLTVLAEGTGAAITAGTVVVQYAQQSWDNSDFYSSWQEGSPQPLTVDASTAPFNALIGVPIGSRVLVEMPSQTVQGQQAPPSALVLDIIKQDTTS